MRRDYRGVHRRGDGRLAWFTLALVTLLTTPTRAALGDDVATVAAAQARLHADLTVSHRGSYAIHELAMPTGIRLHHFVRDDGKVFAVAWAGGGRPYLREVMGSHDDDFIAATRGKPIKRWVARVETRGM